MKKNCSIIKDLLPLYIDGVCSSESKKIVEEHLKECEECQKELNGLNHYVKVSNLKEKKVFLNFVKKINSKILKKSILMVLIVFVVILSVFYISKNIKFIQKYSEDIKVIYHNDNSSDWNFQVYLPKYGAIDSKIVSIKENEENINLIFINIKSALTDRFQRPGSADPDINYASINPRDKIKLYYYADDLDKINENLNEALNNSVLIFENTTNEKNIQCELYGNNYNVNLKYYLGNEQIVDSEGDEYFPDKLLTYIYSIYGDYYSLWFHGDSVSKVYNKLNNYFEKSGGSCILK